MSLIFGLGIPTSTTADFGPFELALAAEDLGFDFVSASDHPCGSNPTYETWTMLCWIAATTSRIRVAPRVLGLPYRQPAMLAKMAETLSRLSGNRLILGLGGGYSDDEFRAFGLGVPTAAEKVTGLQEALIIIKGLWSEPHFSFSGQRYHTSEADIEPKPDQSIPIWLGTFGPRALAVTGRLADGWIPSHGYMSREELPRMRDKVLSAAEAAGRNPDDIACIYNVEIRVDESASSTESVFSGSPDAIAMELLSFVALGFTGFNFIVSGADQAGQVERLAKEVLPLLRGAQ